MSIFRIFLVAAIVLICCRIPEAAEETKRPAALIKIDEAILLGTTMPAPQPLCIDSYLGEDSRPWEVGEGESNEKRIGRIAEVFERVSYRAGLFQILRHERWHDLALTRVRPENSDKLTRQTQVQVIGSDVGALTTVRVDARRSTLNELCGAIQKTTGQRHGAQGEIAERRVTLVTPASTTEELRSVLARLFVDCHWVNDQGTWLFQERSEADRIRQVAETEARRSGRLEEWAEAGLKTQLASELTNAQWRELDQGRTVKRDWSQLSAAGKSLLVGWGRAFADTILTRSNGSAENFTDLGRTQDLGVELRFARGRLGCKCFGRTASGIAVIW